MNRYNDNYNRYNDDRDSYRSRRSYNDRDDRMDEGMRTYSDSSASNYGGVYNTDAWPDRDRYGYNDDRNMFERMGDRIRDSWDDWRGERNDDRYYSDSRGYRDDRDYDERRRRHHGNIFERAGERVRDFFRPPQEQDFSHERRNSVQGMNADYGRTGFGNYEGSYGAYTGVHGTTGFNTGTRDNFTTDYYRHYRPRYDNDMYHEDPINTRYGQREGRYTYRPGDYGSVEVGEFRARERYDNLDRPRYANYNRYR